MAKTPRIKDSYRGLLISFEGPDGSGKSSQALLAYKQLKKEGKKAILLREPGGTAISESIRKIILNKNYRDMTKECEFLLFEASRAQMVRKKIKPHLKSGFIVICDRFSDATFAYQGYGSRINLALINKIDSYARGGLLPDLTILMDIVPGLGLQRAQEAAGHKDRIEGKGTSFHTRVRKGYLELHRKYPSRIYCFDGKADLKKNHEKIMALIKTRLKNKGQSTARTTATKKTKTPPAKKGTEKKPIKKRDRYITL